MVKPAVSVVAAMIGASALLSACAQLTDPGALKAPAAESNIALRAPFVYVVDHETLGSKHTRTITIAAATYTSVRVSALGVYHAGPQSAIVERHVRHDFGNPSLDVTYTHDGGIFIPFDKNLPPRIFIVAGTMRPVADGSANTSTLLATSPAALTPIQAGVAGGLVGAGAAIVSASQQGKFAFYAYRPKDEASLRAALGL